MRSRTALANWKVWKPWMPRQRRSLIDISFDGDKLSLEKIQAELADEGYPATTV